MRSFLIGLTTGAGIAYLLDPDLGRRRRAITRDRFLASLRRGGRRVGRVGRKATSDLVGLGERITHENRNKDSLAA
jgi:hypothetical protein